MGDVRDMCGGGEKGGEVLWMSGEESRYFSDRIGSNVNGICMPLMFEKRNYGFNLEYSKQKSLFE